MRGPFFNARTCSASLSERGNPDPACIVFPPDAQGSRKKLSHCGCGGGEEKRPAGEGR